MNYIEKLSESKLGFSFINGQIITRSTFQEVIIYKSISLYKIIINFLNFLF